MTLAPCPEEEDDDANDGEVDNNIKSNRSIDCETGTSICPDGEENVANNETTTTTTTTTTMTNNSAELHNDDDKEIENDNKIDDNKSLNKEDSFPNMKQQQLSQSSKSERVVDECEETSSSSSPIDPEVNDKKNEKSVDLKSTPAFVDDDDELENEVDELESLGSENGSVSLTVTSNMSNEEEEDEELQRLPILFSKSRSSNSPSQAQDSAFTRRSIIVSSSSSSNSSTRPSTSTSNNNNSSLHNEPPNTNNTLPAPSCPSSRPSNIIESSLLISTRNLGLATIPEDSSLASLIPPRPRYCKYIILSLTLIIGVLLVGLAILVGLLGFAPSVLLSSSSSSQSQPIHRLVGRHAYDQFGYAVSISANGQRMAIGSKGHHHIASDVTRNNQAGGMAQVFENRRGNWVSIGGDLFGAAMDAEFGWDVSLSDDGSVLGVTAFSGRVYLYNLDGDEKTWVPRGKNTLLGHRVDLSQNGGRVVVGGEGFARLYDWNAAIQKWELLGSVEELSWCVVTLSSDGKRMAVGSYLDKENGVDAGRVRLFEYDEEHGLQLLGTALHGDPNQRYGYALSLSGNGNIIAVGMWGGDRIQLFQIHTNTTNTNQQQLMYDWKQLGTDIIGGDIGFGSSISLTNNGNTIVIGSYRYDHFRGRVVIYSFHDGDWNQQGSDIIGDKDFDYEGQAVSISPDGHYIAVGAPSTNQNDLVFCGQVHVYKLEILEDM